jgi:non-specific serine/threonine protein kinase
LWVNGYVSTLQGDIPWAVTLLEECRGYAREAGDPFALAYSTHRLGCNQLCGDDVRHSMTLFEDARASYRRLDVVNSHVMMAAIELAIARVFVGDLDTAAALCEEARTIGAAHGEQWAYAYAIYVQALVSLSRGDFDEATEQGRTCLRIKRTFNDQLGIVLALEVLAWTAAGQRRWERAATMLGSAQRIWQSVGFPMFGSRYFGAPHGACEANTRSALGDERFESIVRHGRELSPEGAIAYALECPGDNGVVSDVAATQLSLLTERELEVAALITDGLSNQEIADRLVISRRTAEGHVNRILRKLGFTTRTQIATWNAQTSVPS